MLVEILPENELAFAYGKELFKDYKGIKYSIVSKEEVQGVDVYTLKLNEVIIEDYKLNFIDVGSLKCKHGNTIAYENINMMPHDGWEELIDCWSCHDGEFKKMLDLKIKPRQKGILVSNLYIIPNEKIMPACCKNKYKLFFNETICKYSDNDIIFNFFDDYFRSKSILIIHYNDEFYDIKFFYSCWIFRFNMEKAIKIGFRKIKNVQATQISINDHYSSFIINELQRNSLGIKTIGYELSFIVQPSPN